MRLQRTVMTLLLAVSFVFGAATLGTDASAGIGGWDNPDLLDIESGFSDDDGYNWAYINQSEDSNFAYGSIWTSTGSGYFSYLSSGAIGLSWNLYEADKVTRSDKKGDLSQKKNVRLAFHIYTDYYGYSSTYSSAFPEKCKASTNVKADKEGDLTQVSWNADCKLDDGDFDLPDAMAERLQELFGKKVVNAKSGKVKIKGKAKENLNVK